MKDIVIFIKENKSGYYYLYTKYPTNKSIVCQIMIDEMICKKTLEFNYDNVKYLRESLNNKTSDVQTFEIQNPNEEFDKLYDNEASTNDKQILKIVYKQIYRKNKRFDFTTEDINNFKNKSNKLINACCMLDIDNKQLIIVSINELLKQLNNNSISLEDLKKLSNNIILDLDDDSVNFYNIMYNEKNILDQDKYKLIINNYLKETEGIIINIKKIK